MGDSFQRETHTDPQKPTASTYRPADLKIILIGDSASGKSKLMERFLLNEYNPRPLSTYAGNVFRYTTFENGREWAVDFWDTAGQEMFDSLHASYYYQANAAILVFDVTRKATYKNLEKWFGELRAANEGVPIICVANKIDVDKTVTKKSFNFATQKDLPFHFVSACDGTNVVRVFQEAISLAVDNKLNPPDVVSKYLTSSGCGVTESA